MQINLNIIIPSIPDLFLSIPNSEIQGFIQNSILYELAVYELYNQFMSVPPAFINCLKSTFLADDSVRSHLLKSHTEFNNNSPFQPTSIFRGYKIKHRPNYVFYLFNDSKKQRPNKYIFYRNCELLVALPTHHLNWPSSSYRSF